ncbi:uncharacterized protein LOC131947925 [Physella acuta]|uniref:uncharacterized protein LOC131947925 n=1 Tax=Physella acuta TaxID=109671 RepID=UPI0027DDCFCD|nr:uncharacterized protein LOC131947925 [Physella acuta]
MGPYVSTNHEGSNITLTCNVTGPENLSIKWKFRNSSLENAVSSLYFQQSGQQIGVPVQVSFGSTCVQYLHSSTLKFQIEKNIGGYVFFCVATANNEETTVGNMTIYVKPKTITPGKNVNDIVNPSVIVEGESFTVTCDATRAGVPSSATTVSNLYIAWTNGTAPPTTYARYRTYNPPYNDSFPPKTSPPRNWIFTFSGNQHDIIKPNNTDTMKIEIVVYDANSADEGVYFCNATYEDEKGNEIKVYRFQLVKNETTTEAQSSERNDYSFLYYVIPVAVLIVVGVIIGTVYFTKVRRERAIQRRRDMRTLPAIRQESLSPPMDSNGYLLPADPNGGYAQIIDIAQYETSENYYSSINELEFIKESDQQFEYRSGFQQNGDNELETKNDVKLGVKTDTQVDIETRKRLDIQNEIQLETKTDEQLGINPKKDSAPADEFNDYTKLYDTPEDVHTPDVNKYSAPIFKSVI